MKRKDIFILAYIAFIMLSVIIKQFYDYSMWNKIVVAVTAVSWMLSLSDSLLNMSTLSKETGQFLPIMEDQRQKAQKLATVSFENKGDEKWTSIEKQYESIIKKSIRLSKHEKPCVILSIVFAFISFVLFMCVLCFEPLYEKFYKDQDFLTVSSFGLILLTQFAIEWWNDSNKTIQGTLVSLSHSLSESLQTHFTTKEKENQNAD